MSESQNKIGLQRKDTERELIISLLQSVFVFCQTIEEDVVVRSSCSDSCKLDSLPCAEVAVFAPRKAIEFERSL